MNTAPSAEALDFEQSVSALLTASGGFEHVQRAERDPGYRQTISEALGQVGLWELEPGDELQLEAAALACRALGRFAVPYPAAERIAARARAGTGAVAVVAGPSPRIAHADLELGWTAVDLDGRTAPVAGFGQPVGGKLGQFVVPVELGRWDGSGPLAPLVLTLQTWTLLGMLQAAQDLTCAHVRDRVQFGQPLAAFQAVQFALTDVAVATQGLEELGKYTLWTVGRDGAAAMADALSFRAASLEAAETTFRVAHQLHGAMGFCDESPLSWLSRYTQALRRLPLGRSATESRLAEEIARAGFYSPVA